MHICDSSRDCCQLSLKYYSAILSRSSCEQNQACCFASRPLICESIPAQTGELELASFHRNDSFIVNKSNKSSSGTTSWNFADNSIITMNVESWCTVELNSKQDWLRANRKHNPSAFTSAVFKGDSNQHHASRLDFKSTERLQNTRPSHLHVSVCSEERGM